MTVSDTMTAFRMTEWGRPPELISIPVPVPASDEVLIRVSAAGLCHSDLLISGSTPGSLGAFEPPFTLGHETSGQVVTCGSDVTGIAEGTQVLIGPGPRCGRCTFCRRGDDNYCRNKSGGRGYGLDGGLAEYVVALEREVIALDGLDAILAAPLSCAGLTAYHAVRRAAMHTHADSIATVIGVGGIGGFVVQFLKSFTPSTVVAVDSLRAAREYAADIGADHVVDPSSLVDSQLDSIACGEGADVVIDCVGTSATISTAMAHVKPLGTVAIVGAGGGVAQVGWGASPLGASVFVPMNGTMNELRELVSLAGRGAVRIDVQHFAFEDVEGAYGLLEAGEVRGRAVVTMGSRTAPVSVGPHLPRRMP